MQEVKSESDFVRNALATEVPLEDGLPIAPDARQRVPQIAIVHEVHRQDRVALHNVIRAGVESPHLSGILACFIAVSFEDVYQGGTDLQSQYAPQQQAIMYRATEAGCHSQRGDTMPYSAAAQASCCLKPFCACRFLNRRKASNVWKPPRLPRKTTNIDNYRQ